jgi:hypothetical protein
MVEMILVRFPHKSHGGFLARRGGRGGGGRKLRRSSSMTSVKDLLREKESEKRELKERLNEKKEKVERMFLEATQLEMVINRLKSDLRKKDEALAHEREQSRKMKARLTKELDAQFDTTLRSSIDDSLAFFQEELRKVSAMQQYDFRGRTKAFSSSHPATILMDYEEEGEGEERGGGEGVERLRAELRSQRESSVSERSLYETKLRQMEEERRQREGVLRKAFKELKEKKRREKKAFQFELTSALSRSRKLEKLILSKTELAVPSKPWQRNPSKYQMTAHIMERLDVDNHQEEEEEEERVDVMQGTIARALRSSKPLLSDSEEEEGTKEEEKKADTVASRQEHERIRLLSSQVQSLKAANKSLQRQLEARKRRKKQPVHAIDHTQTA